MNKGNVIYTYNRILFGLKKEYTIQQYVTTWMNLEDTMLSEMSRLHDKYYTISFT